MRAKKKNRLNLRLSSIRLLYNRITKQNIPLVLYRNILEDINNEIVDKILSNNIVYRLPHGIGKLYLVCGENSYKRRMHTMKIVKFNTKDLKDNDRALESINNQYYYKLRLDLGSASAIKNKRYLTFIPNEGTAHKLLKFASTVINHNNYTPI